MAVVSVVRKVHRIEYYHRTIDGVAGKRFECECGWHSQLSKNDADIRPSAHGHLEVDEPFLAFYIEAPQSPLPPKYPGVMRRGTGEVFHGED